MDRIAVYVKVRDIDSMGGVIAGEAQTGRLTFLAGFFKSPYGVEEQGFGRQFQMLQQWAEAQ